MPPSEGETEAILRDVRSAVAAALRPVAMVGRPVLGAVLLPGIVALPAAVLYPAALLLPGSCLLVGALGRLAALGLLVALWLLWTLGLLLALRLLLLRLLWTLGLLLALRLLLLRLLRTLGLLLALRRLLLRRLLRTLGLLLALRRLLLRRLLWTLGLLLALRRLSLRRLASPGLLSRLALFLVLFSALLSIGGSQPSHEKEDGGRRGHSGISHDQDRRLVLPRTAEPSKSPRPAANRNAPAGYLVMVCRTPLSIFAAS